jgi:hypothetical protein
MYGWCNRSVSVAHCYSMILCNAHLLDLIWRCKTAKLDFVFLGFIKA